MQHLDEGTIHAWLDGALTAEEAARVQQHTRVCGDCAALVAEARGFVAGASRILSALDDVPAVGPASGGWSVERGARREVGSGKWEAEPQRPEALPLQGGRPRRPLWSRPAAMAAAAGVVLMAGSAIVLNRSGGRDSLAGSTDTLLDISLPRTEAAAERGVATRTAGATTGAALGAAGRSDGAGGGASAPVPLAPAAPRERQSTAADARARITGSRRGVPLAQRFEDAAVRDSVSAEAVTTTGVRPTDAAVARVYSGRVSANKAVTQKAAAAPVAPPAPGPPASGGDQAVIAGRAPAQRRAVAARARAQEMAPSAAADAARPGRIDTVYEAGVNRVVTDAPAANRSQGSPDPERPFPVTGCYRVLQGGLPRTLTLTTKPVWSGVAEHRFEATGPGAVGYWSQPRSGDVHVVIAGALVTATIDARTGELRGLVRRGRNSEPFFATRC